MVRTSAGASISRDVVLARFSSYWAFDQVFEPVSFTDTSVKKIRAGLPIHVPR